MMPLDRYLQHSTVLYMKGVTAQHHSRTKGGPGVPSTSRRGFQPQRRKGRLSAGRERQGGARASEQASIQRNKQAPSSSPSPSPGRSAHTQYDTILYLLHVQYRIIPYAIDSVLTVLYSGLNCTNTHLRLARPAVRPPAGCLRPIRPRVIQYSTSQRSATLVLWNGYL